MANHKSRAMFCIPCAERLRCSLCDRRLGCSFRNAKQTVVVGRPIRLRRRRSGRESTDCAGARRLENEAARIPGNQIEKKGTVRRPSVGGDLGARCLGVGRELRKLGNRADQDYVRAADAILWPAPRPGQRQRPRPPASVGARRGPACATSTPPVASSRARHPAAAPPNSRGAIARSRCAT